MKSNKETLVKICESMEEKKGEDIRILDISEICSFTDYFIICHGYNQRQNQAICDSVKECLKKADQLTPLHIEGYDSAEWILMDYVDCVVHIFSPESRKFYKLERLWSDGIKLTREALIA